MAPLAGLLVLLGVLLVAALFYWLLVLTEGVYLGPRVVTGLYNRVARRYDTIKQFDDEDEAYFLGRPIERFLAAGAAASSAPPWVLDVASGTGRLPLALVQAGAAGCRVVALDSASAMLHEAQRKLSRLGRHDIVYLVHDASRLPFSAGQFTVVSCLEALEFMPRPSAVLAELLRVAAPGGLLVLTNRIGREARLMPGKTFGQQELAETLRGLGAGGVEIRPWQMDYDLVLAVKQGTRQPTAAVAWNELLQCPVCGSTALEQRDAQAVVCGACGWHIEQQAGLWQATATAAAAPGQRRVR